MSEWVRLDEETLNPSQSQAVRGVNITVRMSPYDVPEAVRGYYDDRGRFIIEFRYIGNEQPFKQRREAGYITLLIGRHSGRICEIEIDVDAMRAEAVDLNLEISNAVLNAIDNSLDHFPPKRSPHDNYVVAKDAIARNKGDIFASLEGATQ